MEVISHHQPEAFRKDQKETTQVRPPTRILAGNHLGCTTMKDSESEWLAKDNLEINPITIKPETASHMVELFSWVPLPYCFPPGCPFPIKSLALSAHVSPRIIHFRVLDKSPASGPGCGSPPTTPPPLSLLFLSLPILINLYTLGKNEKPVKYFLFQRWS